MSKRYSRRPRNPNLPDHAYNTPADPVAPVATAAPAGRATAVKATAAVAALPRTKDWRLEYGEVIGDLRRTAVIFVGLIVVMVALSFIIR